MKKAVKTELLQQFASLAGLVPEEITAQITALNPALSEKDVAELVKELSAPPPPPGPPATQQPPAPPETNPGNSAPAPENVNRVFEEWRVEPIFKKHEATRSTNAWTELVGYTKLKKEKDVRISADRAALQNEHSQTSLIRYYDQETGVAAGENK